MYTYRHIPIYIYLHACLCGNQARALRGTIERWQDACGQLLTLIRIFSRELGYRHPPINKLVLGMFRVAGKPIRFKGKAAETRYMVPIMCEILRRFPHESPHDSTRLHCLEALNRVYLEMYNWGEGSSNRIGEFGRQHCILFAVLATEQYARNPDVGLFLWRLFPKHHLFLHLVEDQVKKGGNPSYHWCYADEREIGNAATLSETMHPRTLNKVLMQRYRSFHDDLYKN